MPKDASLCSVWCNDSKKALREKRTAINLRCQSTSRPITKDCQKEKKEKEKDENNQPLLFTMTIRNNYQLSANRNEFLQRP